MSATALVRQRSFRLLLVGQAVSSLGDWMATVAFIALALELTGSPAAVGGVLAVRLLPALAAGPLAGRVARRWDRRRTMLAMDLARVGIVALVPLVEAVWWVYVLAGLLEVAGLVFLPARDTIIPEVVDRTDLPLANGLVLASSYGTIPFGAAAFAGLAAVPLDDLLSRPLALVFWVDAATYVVSFLLIARLPAGVGRSAPPPDATPTGDPPPGRFRDAFSLPLVRAIVPATSAVALGLGALFSTGIVFVQEVLGATDTEFGWLIAVFGGGAAVGLVVLHRSRQSPTTAVVRAGVAAMGAVVAAFSLAANLPLAYLGAAAFGAAVSYTLAAAMSVLQGRLDGRDLQLAFTAFHVTIRLGLGVAAIVAGVAADLVGAVDWPVVGDLEPARAVLLASGCVVLASSTAIVEPGSRDT